MKAQILLMWIAVTAALALPAVAEHSEDHLRFVMVSHIGESDANMVWLTESLRAFEAKYPNVTTEYLTASPDRTDALLQLLEQVIASEPDGIVIPIVSSDAFDEPLRRAIAAGIPVVAFNVPDLRPKPDRIPYLTYVGGDEFLTGFNLGQHALLKVSAGVVPRPTGVVCMSSRAALHGEQARCDGLRRAMSNVGAQTEALFVGEDEAAARRAMQNYLSAHPQTNYIFTVAGWMSRWAWEVADELKLSPDVDRIGVTIITVDETPASIEGIRQGRVLAANSQGYWMQGYAPMEWLYWYRTLGYEPDTDFLTGPVIIDSENADAWAALVRAVFGDAEYDQMNAWQDR